MEEAVAYLQKSIKDTYFSKKEAELLTDILQRQGFGQNEIQQLRRKTLDIAREYATDRNHDFVLQWLEATLHVLCTYSSGGSTQAYFSPGETCRGAIISELKNATNEVLICVFTISDDLITEEIIRTHRRGIHIRIITDNDKLYDKGSDIRRLVQEGLTLQVDKTDSHMHHKFMVVDRDTLLTGSYNWTRSAARYNHENILVTKDSKAVKAYLETFTSLWKETVTI